ncbi:hypothetical protein ASPACDRAFT_46638 [Aspergillus aculeatus ATCC 16872]|uniref:DUF7587 domain-containing protein n=1 Tax=Aspergillus aculeatus (strain ATCC 16872 / CBS 172.66 / WB 5094) TaxID=690307 RepID=A0A1L9WJX8_ASPA1|nr:uncharacterized protein ASPACDRAFT_46638 [Aspergillus aculeatus ATCC 16872]OJJ96470.1 hypothetical protein ASPACDRAFT_46638 [Aspergillus aculeatus ATCC 16872]
MTVETIIESFQDFNINAQFQPLCFNPPAALKATCSSLSKTPTYLFRVASAKTSAKTSSTWVRPKSTLPHREDIFSNLNEGKKRDRIAALLNDHLWWKEPSNDPFVSWTSSLLFALQYIYFRRWSYRDGSPLDKINLYVIDTTEFPRGTFIRDLDLLNVFLENDPKPHGEGLARLKEFRDAELYFGEYLSQGALQIEGKCQVISAQSLCEGNRLRRIQPAFADIQLPQQRPRWANEVLRLRGVLETRRQTHPAVPHDCMQALREIVDLFEDPAWRLPMAAYFAALMGDLTETATASITTIPVGVTAAALLEELRSYHESSDIGLDCDQLKTKVIAPAAMPELTQTEKIFRRVHKDYTLRKALDTLGKARSFLGRLGSIAATVSAVDPDRTVAKEILSEVNTIIMDSNLIVCMDAFPQRLSS